MRVMSDVPSVGDIIHEMYLNPSAMSVADGARCCGMTLARFAAIVSGTQRLTSQIALQLAQGFSASAHEWLAAERCWLQAQLMAVEAVLHVPATVALTRQIAHSYQQLLGRPLVTEGNDVALVQQLYLLPAVVLAHDGADDPCFTYANLAAQQLWQMEWQQLVGMPSRYSAEPDHRDSRAELLTQVAQQGYIDNYHGVRISASGQRFEIQRAVVFNLFDMQGHKAGQAATFADWQAIQG